MPAPDQRNHKQNRQISARGHGVTVENQAALTDIYR